MEAFRARLSGDLIRLVEQHELTSCVIRQPQIRPVEAPARQSEPELKAGPWPWSVPLFLWTCGGWLWV